MTSGMPVKLVGFTAMQALPDRGDRPPPREEVAALAKAGKKNRHVEQSPATLNIIDDLDQLPGLFKSRLDVSKVRPVMKDRLGNAGLDHGWESLARRHMLAFLKKGICAVGGLEFLGQAVLGQVPRIVTRSVPLTASVVVESTIVAAVPVGEGELAR